jgi:hypothetical protein
MPPAIRCLRLILCARFWCATFMRQKLFSTIVIRGRGCSRHSLVAPRSKQKRSGDHHHKQDEHEGNPSVVRQFHRSRNALTDFPFWFIKGRRSNLRATFLPSPGIEVDTRVQAHTSSELRSCALFLISNGCEVGGSKKRSSIGISFVPKWPRRSQQW